MIIHEFGHFIAAKRQGVKIEKFSFGFGPRLFGIKKGDTDYAVSLIPLGGYVKMAGDEPALAKGEGFEYLSKSVWQRFLIVLCGPFLNYLLGFLLFWFVFFIGAPTATSRVGEILKGYPAESAGLKQNDRIISVDGKATKYWEALTDIIHNKTDGSLKLIVERETDGVKKTREITLTPKRKEITDIFGKKRVISLIGVSPSGEVISVRYGLFDSFFKAGQQIARLTGITYKSLLFIATGKMSVKESMTGPIGIFIITRQAAKLGLVYLLQMMAILSASLAIFNLLPIPVLDGGHILFLIIEKIKGRPLSAKAQEIATQAGLFLLIALMVFVFYSDTLKFILKR